MSRFLRHRPAARPGAAILGLGVETLEPRYACATLTGAVATAFVPVSATDAPAMASRAPQPPAPSGVTATPLTPPLTAGVRYSGPVCHVDVAAVGTDSGVSLGFQARIDWGDGHETTGVVQAAPDGGFDVLGTATYATPGEYKMSVELAGTDGTSISVAGTVKVDPPVRLAGHVDVSASTPPHLEETTFDPPRGTPALSAPTPPVRPPADTAGAVPWVRLPDPRPVAEIPGATVADRGRPLADAAIPATPARVPAQAVGAGGAVDGPTGPVYLAAADEAAVEFHGAPASEVTPPDVYPGMVVAAENVERPLVVVDTNSAGEPDTPVARLDTGPPADMCAAFRLSADDSASGRRLRWGPNGLWWKSLAWCIALVFANETLTPRSASRLRPKLAAKGRRNADMV
jgi:hypothetical protein